jgi:hypothetical protein
MRIHPREELVDEGEKILREAIGKLYKLSLTHDEFIRVVTDVMSNTILQSTKYAIRMERHGDREQPGGLE